MKITEQTKKIIYNLRLPIPEPDFKLHAFSFIIALIFYSLALIVQSYFYPQSLFDHFIYFGIGFILILGLSSHLPFWALLLSLVATGWLLTFAFLGHSYLYLLSIASLGLILAPTFQMAQHWEKAIVLRFGKFRRCCGPGLFLILPLIERVAEFVDTRIRATDFSAETTLTRDTVPVHVDAIAFWMIWDPRKAVLELEHFLDAVVLSAQTALRDAIGKNDLATLLSERDRLGKEIQNILEAKTSAWGISILSIEIRDIIIPKELEDSMSKRAQAERERQSRVILGTAEVEIAQKFAEAAECYKNNQTALHLRAMNMLYEGLKKNSSLVLVPSSAIETMTLGTVLGASALSQLEKEKEEKTDDKPS